MGILTSFLPSSLTGNPIYQGISSGLTNNSNAIAGFSNAILAGANPTSYTGPTPPGGQVPNPLADALAAAVTGHAADKKVQDDAAAANQTTQALAKFPDLAAAVASKALTPQQAYVEMFHRMDAKATTDLASTATGRATLAEQQGLTGTDKTNYILMGKMPDMWTPLTDPAERLAAGIPETDKTPLQQNSQGQIRPIAGTGASGAAGGDGTAQSIADGIKKGITPPSTAGLYKYGAPVKAILANDGYDFTKASEDYQATTTLLKTMNGTQQTRLRQAVGQVSDTLDKAQQLADEWKGAGFAPFNSVTLKLAASGAPGFSPAQQSLATRLIAQVADVTVDLGNVYMGGNTPTDHAMELAATQLKADWSQQTFDDAVKQAKENIQYRINSLKLSTAGIPDSQYNQMSAPAAPAGGAGQVFTYNPTSGQLE